MKPRITYAREELGAILDEVKPLLRQQWEALGQKDLTYDPDWDALLTLQKLGMLFILTVRANRQLIGYNAFIVNRHLHYKGDTVAINDTIWVSPEYRRGRVGVRLIEYARLALEAQKVSKIFYHCKPSAPELDALLDRLGYRLEETVRALPVGAA